METGDGNIHAFVVHFAGIYLTVTANSSKIEKHI